MCLHACIYGYRRKYVGIGDVYMRVCAHVPVYVGICIVLFFSLFSKHG